LRFDYKEYLEFVLDDMYNIVFLSNEWYGHMARITVEDCEEIVQNRFDLAILAAQRARQIFAGAKITVENKDEKRPIIALREIAEQTVPVDKLREKVIEKFRTFVVDSANEDGIEELMEEDSYNPYIGLENKTPE
jgi:DNA-directed RNA polymerase subunit omega